MLFIQYPAVISGKSYNRTNISCIAKCFFANYNKSFLTTDSIGILDCDALQADFYTLSSDFSLMQSPFPGMDPFLEGHLWPDFHQTLATYIKAHLVPQVSPKYLVQTVVYTVSDTEIWAIDLKDFLPVIPTPLLPGDEDAMLDVGKAFRETYQMSQYQLAIDYSETPPPPAFSAKEKEWISARLDRKRTHE